MESNTLASANFGSNRLGLTGFPSPIDMSLCKFVYWIIGIAAKPLAQLSELLGADAQGCPTGQYSPRHGKP
jgi:hypothetical protein